VLCCGICGSDLHGYRGPWGQDAKPGHEFCAVVEAVGQGVMGLPPGMRVAGECFAHCGRCPACECGDYNHCEAIVWSPGRPAGALAQYVAWPAASLLPVPEGLSDEQAALVEPTAVAFRAVARSGLRKGESAAVVGAGTIGLLCAAVAAARGAGRVFVLTRYPHQAEAAARLGVSDPLPPEAGDPRRAVRKRTGGRGADVVIDAVAAGTSLSTAFSLARPQGRVVEVGGPTRPLMVALGPLVSGELRLCGSNCYAVTEGRRDMQWAMDLIEGGRVRPEALVTHRFPLDRAAEAFATAADKKSGSIKVLALP